MTAAPPVSERTLRKRRRAAGEPPQPRGRKLAADGARVRLSVRVLPPIREALGRESASRGVSIATIVEAAVATYLGLPHPGPPRGEP